MRRQIRLGAWDAHLIYKEWGARTMRVRVCVYYEVVCGSEWFGWYRVMSFHALWVSKNFVLTFYDNVDEIGLFDVFLWNSLWNDEQCGNVLRGLLAFYNLEQSLGSVCIFPDIFGAKNKNDNDSWSIKIEVKMKNFANFSKNTQISEFGGISKFLVAVFFVIFGFSSKNFFFLRTNLLFFA